MENILRIWVYIAVLKRIKPQLCVFQCCVIQANLSLVSNLKGRATIRINTISSISIDRSMVGIGLLKFKTKYHCLLTEAKNK